MSDRIRITALVTMLSSQEGGRSRPLGPGPSTYRPHLVIGDPDQRGLALDCADGNGAELLGVQFPELFETLRAGSAYKLELLLLYSGVDYGDLVSGATFTIREGRRRVVGYGTVLKGVDSNLG
jgi:hypothetical protein